MSWLAWAAVTAIFWALGPIFAKLGLVKSDPYVALTARTMAVALVLFVWGVASGKLTGLQHLEPRTWLLLAAEGLAASVIGHFAYFNALKAGPVAQVVPITASYPLLAMLLSVLLLGNPITLGKGIGGLLIAAGIYLIQRY